MSRVEVLCVSMHQSDLSLIKKLKVKTDTLIANQTNHCGELVQIDGGNIYKLISTNTVGVGKNRNISLIHSTGEILLFSDDDMEFYDSYETDIISEFEHYPNADVFIFNIDSNSKSRKQIKNKKTRRLGKFSRLPYGAPRIAIRRNSWEKSNIWFTPLFGGGAKYTSGEDSLFLKQLQRAGLRIYVSNKTIGTIDMTESSWYSGANEEFYFNKGAYCNATGRNPVLWALYYSLRVRSEKQMRQRISWFFKGFFAFDSGRTYLECIEGR